MAERQEFTAFAQAKRAKVAGSLQTLRVDLRTHWTVVATPARQRMKELRQLTGQGNKLRASADQVPPGPAPGLA